MQFADILQPLAVTSFFETYWEKQPLHIPRGDIEFYRPLFGLEDLAELFHNAHSRARDTMDGNLIFFRNQEQVPLKSSPSFAYMNECSVVINHADECSRKIAVACDALTSAFPYVYCNMYLTPPLNSTVRAHSDDRDVLLLQIFGEKRWKVYGSPQYLPFKDEEVGKTSPVPPGDLTQPLLDIIVKQGDVLYLPRGFVHVAETTSVGPSLHFTMAIGASHWTVGTVIVNALNTTLRREEFNCYRQSIPLPVQRGNVEYLAQLGVLLSEAKVSAMATVTADSVLELFDLHIQNMQEVRTRVVSRLPVMDRVPVSSSSSLRFAREGISLRAVESLAVPPVPELPAMNTVMFFMEREGGKMEITTTAAVVSLIKDLFDTRRSTLVRDLVPSDQIMSMCIALVFLRNGCFCISDE